jgi:chromosomal replication initiator protein
MTFDDFFGVPSNELALRAARTVAEAPGAVYNPLVIYGPSGTGKTHLLEALAARASEMDGDITVLLTDPDRLAEMVTSGLG